MNDPSEQKHVALSYMGSLVLTQTPEMTSDVGEQTRVRSLEFSQALTSHATCLAVGSMVGTVDENQQELDQALNDDDVKLVDGGDENGSGGN